MLHHIKYREKLEVTGQQADRLDIVVYSGSFVGS